MEYNGSALVAMCGKDCVALASDRRLGVQQTTVGNNMKKMFRVHDSLYMGLSGLASDVQRVSKEISFKMALYELREERNIKPQSFGNMLCSFLYEKFDRCKILFDRFLVLVPSAKIESHFFPNI